MKVNMNHPQNGERVHVIPTPGMKVQRGENMFGQFIAAKGELLLWDEFLHRRLEEGALSWKPLQEVADAADPA